MTIGHGRALGQIGLAVALRDRLPKVAARFLAGHLSPAMISTIVWRTGQVLDAVALAGIDSEIAEHAPGWGPLSHYTLEQAIDVWIERYDPDAVRRVRNTVRGRDFTIGHRDDSTGTASVYGRLTITDAVLLDQRIAVLIASVCDDDPRTLGQRRADAVDAIAAGATHLMYRCDHPTCAAKVDDGRASNVTIHIIGDNEALDAAHDQKMHGRGIDLPPARTQPAKPEPGAESGANEPKPVKPAEPAEPAETAEPAQAEPVRPRTAALIPGANGAIVPAPLLAELLAYGAKVRFVGAPSPGEDRYRPSTALQEFVRTRDLTCRFPGCDRPAVAADIDHTVPWPAGATHPANTKCYCRLHHLVKLSGTAGPTARTPTPPSPSPPPPVCRTPRNPSAACCSRNGTPPPHPHPRNSQQRHRPARAGT